MTIEHRRLGIEPRCLGRFGQLEILLGLVLHRLQRQKALAIEFGRLVADQRPNALWPAWVQ